MQDLLQLYRRYCEFFAYEDQDGDIVVPAENVIGVQCVILKVLNEFKITLKQDDLLSCSAIITSLEDLKNSLDEGDDVEIDDEFYEFSDDIIEQLTPFFPANASIIAFQVAMDLIAQHENEPAPPREGTFRPKTFTQTFEPYIEYLLNSDRQLQEQCIHETSPSALIEFAADNHAFFNALFSQNVETRREKGISKEMETDLAQCNKELVTYVKRIDKVANLRKRAAVLLADEDLYHVKVEVLTPDRATFIAPSFPITIDANFSFTPEAHTPAHQRSGLFTSLLDAFTGWDDTNYYSYFIASQEFSLDNPAEAATSVETNEANTEEAKLPSEVKRKKAEIQASDLPAELKRWITFTKLTPSQLARIPSGEHQPAVTGRFELRYQQAMKQWLNVAELNETAMQAALKTLKKACDLGWSVHEIKYGHGGKFHRDDSAALKLLLFRFPRLEEILLRHLNSLKQAATTWKAAQAPVSPRGPLTPHLPRSPHTPSGTVMRRLLEEAKGDKENTVTSTTTLLHSSSPIIAKSPKRKADEATLDASTDHMDLRRRLDK